MFNHSRKEQNPLKPDVTNAIDALKAGGLIAYPTETVYGLGCGLFFPDAIERLYRLKERDATHAVLVLVNGKSMLESLVEDMNPTAEKLINIFWPGPLTLIFRAQSHITTQITGAGHTLGIRQSPDPWCIQLLEHFQQPIISTSANPTGLPPAATYQEVLHYFPQVLDAVIDGGPRQKGRPSTVCDVSSKSVNLLREGDITFEQIKEVIGDV